MVLIIKLSMIIKGGIHMNTNENNVMHGEWGLPMESVRAYWGARAIYKPHDKYRKIDILYVNPALARSLTVTNWSAG
jgi:hypothetical protein